MYWLFGIILYLTKLKGLHIEWYWYLLAFVETLSTTQNINLTYYKGKQNGRNTQERMGNE